MAAVINIDRMDEGYATILNYVMTRGERTAPRGKLTVEVPDVTIVLSKPWHAVPVSTGRKLHTPIAAVESLQLLAGWQHPPRLLSASRHFGEFMEGGSFHGGYGTRLRSQMPKLIERLKQDNYTRRAVVSIWDPLHDLFVDDALDYPCTLSFTFTIRDEQLIMHTYMRSNDAWRGLPYDIVQFTQVQQAVAAVLDVSPGEYVHHAVSLHLYEEDWPMVGNVKFASGSAPLNSLVRSGLCTWETVQRAARDLLETGSTNPRGLDKEVLKWYQDRLAKL